MPRPKNKFPKKEQTHFQRTVSFKLRQKGKDWTWLEKRLSETSESHFRSMMNGTKAPSLDLVFQVGKELKTAPKALIGTDKFTLRKQSVARSNIPALLEKYNINRAALENIYQIPPTTAKRIIKGANLDYKNIQELYMKVFRPHGVESILDLITFE